MTTTPLNKSQSNVTRDLSLVSVFAAFIAVCAIMPAFPVGAAGVPITFQTLAIYITALVLGGRLGGLSTLLYVVVGLIGLPVFSGFKGGIGSLAGGSAGYLIGFAPGALIIGLIAYQVSKGRRSTTALAGGYAFAVLMGYLVITVFGIAGMMVNLGLPLDKAIFATFPFIPGDIIKGILAVLVALSVHRAFPQLIKA